MKQLKLMIFVALLTMAGCKNVDRELTLLRSHEWQLKSMTVAGETVDNPQELPTLSFSDSTAVYGMAGCNRFFGTYAVGEKQQMEITPNGATMMFCPDMAFEDRYMKALSDVKNFTVQANELILENGDSKLKLVYLPVQSGERSTSVVTDSVAE